MAEASAKAVKAEEASTTKEWTGFPRIGIANGIPMSSSGEVGMGPDGKPILSAGAFFLKEPELYAKTLKFRPLKYVFSYLKYDKDFKVVSNSLYMPMGTFYYDEGIFDTSGGERCGRPDNVQMKKLSDDEQRYIRSHHPLYVSLFGLAYFKENEPTLVELRVSKRKLFQLSKGVEGVVKSTYSGKITFQNAVAAYEQELPKHMFSLMLKHEKGPDGKPRFAPTGNPIWELAVDSVGYNQPSKDIAGAMEEVNAFIRDANNKTMEAYEVSSKGNEVVAAVVADDAPWDNDDAE